MKKVITVIVSFVFIWGVFPFEGGVSLAGKVKANLSCSNDGKNFNAWKAAFKKKYGNRFKASTLAKLDPVTYDRSIIRLDRSNKKSFKGSFETFYKRRTKGALAITLKRWRSNADTLVRLEKIYGVQPEVLMSIWVLETAFGRYLGDKNILRSLATLAYDCRRSDSLFFHEFLAAMTIIDRDFLDLSTRKGAWAGEIGQTQLLASRFLLGATDFDGGGVDVYHSVPDALATTANWFMKRGWKRNGGYMPGTVNYVLIQEWNRADNYQKTIAFFARELKNAR